MASGAVHRCCGFQVVSGVRPAGAAQDDQGAVAARAARVHPERTGFRGRYPVQRSGGQTQVRGGVPGTIAAPQRSALLELVPVGPPVPGAGRTGHPRRNCSAGQSGGRALATLWRIDVERVYVAGISAGGGMALVLAATYPELFAAVGVHSAPPYRSASGPANALAAMQGAALKGAAAQVPADVIEMEGMPPLIVFQGTADSTVRRVNAQRVADQWLSYHRHGGTGRAAAIGPPRTATTLPTRPASARARRGYQVNRWYVGGRKVLEVWVVDGLGHAWSGGSSSGSFSDARGPRASTAMWKFFGAHRSVTAAAVLVS